MIRMYNTKTFTEIYDSATAFTTDYSTIDLGGITDSSLVTKLYYLLYAKYGNSPIANLDETQFKYKLFSLIFQYGPNWEKELNIQGILRNLQLSDLVDDGNIHDILTHGASGSVKVSGTNGNTKTYDLEVGASGSSTNNKTYTESGTNTGTQSTAHTGTVGETGSSTTSIDHDNTISNTGQFEDIKNHAANPATDPAGPSYRPLSYINDQVANKNTSSSSQTVDETTETTGSNTSTTTYNNTDTTTNNLATETSGTSSDTGSTSNKETTDGTITDAGTNSSSTTSSDEAEDEATKTLTIGKLKGYERLLSLLNSNITAEFLKRFKPLFQQVVNTRVYLYESED